MSARLLLGLFLPLFFSSGCNPPSGPAPQSEEEYTDERIRSLQELGDLLSKITDERSAKENYPRVQTVCHKLRDNRIQSEKAKKAWQKEKYPPKPPSEFAKKRQQSAVDDGLNRVVVEFKRLKALPPAQLVREEVQAVLNADRIFP